MTLENRLVDEIAHQVEALAVPGIGHPVVAEIGEGDAAGGIAPAIRAADAPMAERAGRGEGAEAADRRRRAAQMRAEAAMHRHAHILVDAVAGVVADGIGEGARREEAGAAPRAALQPDR